MRPLHVVLLTVLAAGALAWFLLHEEAPPREPRTPAPSEAADPVDPHLLLRTGTLVIRVVAPDGSVPAGAEVGYVHDGRRRTVYAGENGRRPFADAPLGELQVFAKAPGYPEVTLHRVIVPGVVSEVVIELEPDGP